MNTPHSVLPSLVLQYPAMRALLLASLLLVLCVALVDGSSVGDARGVSVFLGASWAQHPLAAQVRYVSHCLVPLRALLASVLLLLPFLPIFLSAVPAARLVDLQLFFVPDAPLSPSPSTSTANS